MSDRTSVPMADPDRTASNALYVPKESTANAQYVLDVDPKRAGWTHSSLRVVELAPGGTHIFTTGDSEWIVLPLSGGCTVNTGDEQFQILGRDSVFSGVTDFAYVPRDARAQIASGAGGRFALAGAKCERLLPARYGPAPEVPVEDRGSGNYARQVRNFASADAFECDQLIAVEVITPGGNWSSYPPHKHDEHRPGRRAGSKRSTTSRSTARTDSAISAYSLHAWADPTSSLRSAPAMPSSSPTDGTARPSPSPATRCTT